MPRLSVRSRKLAALCMTALIGVGAAVAVAQAVPVGSAPASTVFPTARPRPPTLATGTVPAPARMMPAVPPGVSQQVPAPYDPKANYPGVPAIRSSLPVMAAAVPALTEQDVRAYFTGRSSVGRVGAAGITVQRVLFLPNVEVRKQFGYAPDTMDDRLICAVELSGGFTVSGPSGTTPVIRPTAVVFFDAKTGNLLEVNVP